LLRATIHDEPDDPHEVFDPTEDYWTRFKKRTAWVFDRVFASGAVRLEGLEGGPK